MRQIACDGIVTAIFYLRGGVRYAKKEIDEAPQRTATHSFANVFSAALAIAEHT